MRVKGGILWWLATELLITIYTIVVSSLAQAVAIVSFSATISWPLTAGILWLVINVITVYDRRLAPQQPPLPALVLLLTESVLLALAALLTVLIYLLILSAGVQTDFLLLTIGVWTALNLLLILSGRG